MALYLSKLFINAESAPQQAYPADIARMHSLIYSLFGNLQGQRVLWSEETARNSAMTRNQAGKTVLILSSIKPVADQAWLKISSIEIKEPFFEHKIYRFRLKANCVKEQKNKRLAITEDAELKEWLKRQLTAGGCELLGCDVIERNAVKIKHRKDAAAGVFMTFNSCIFLGELQVNDISKFRCMFAKGLGKAKAFGFGLMQIAPLA